MEDTIKFKCAGTSDTFYKIDTKTGAKISFSINSKPKTMGHGFTKEMEAWKNAGNEIEPQFIKQELIEKEEKDKERLLQLQKSKCILLLRETDHKVLPDAEYPEDVQQWVLLRIKWRQIYKSNIIENIPEKLNF